MVSMRRHRRAPRNSVEYVESSSMTSIAHSDTFHSETSSRPRSRNTGFPEPFCGNRNTTLPHPDANISPDACITQDDISLSRVHSRQRHSFLAKKKRATSHGVITPEMEQIYSGMAAVGSDSEHSPIGDGPDRLPTIPGTPVVGHVARPPSKDGGASFVSTSSDDHGNSTDRHHQYRTRLSSDGGSSVKSSKRRGVMERLGISHHRR